MIQTTTTEAPQGHSKQRNKHIQRVGGSREAGTRQDHDLALVYEREKQKGNANRAALAVARKPLPLWLWPQLLEIRVPQCQAVLGPPTRRRLAQR